MPSFSLQIKEPKPGVQFKINEVDQYSQISKTKIEFNDSRLSNYVIPKRIIDDKGNYLMNIKKGLNSKFESKVFTEDESRIGNLLRVMIHYENNEKCKDKDVRPKIVSHSGLYKDIAVNDDKYPYDVVCYKGQLFFASTDRRLNNDELFNYCGIKFEKYLTDSKIDKVIDKQLRNSIEHFKTLNLVEFGNCEDSRILGLTVAEMDTVKDRNKPFNEREYVEIKSTICHYCKNINNLSKLKLLERLSSNKYFLNKMYNWLNQCLFNGVKHLIIGVRDSSFNIHKIYEYKIKELEDFLKQKNHELFMRYETAIERVSQVIKRLIDEVEEGKVYKFHIKKGDLFELNEVLIKSEIDKIKNNVLIKEFQNWREYKKVPVGIEKGMSLVPLDELSDELNLLSIN